MVCLLVPPNSSRFLLFPGTIHENSLFQDVSAEMFLLELMQAWVRWIDTHIKSIQMSKIEKRSPKSIRFTHIHFQFWITSITFVLG